MRKSSLVSFVAPWVGFAAVVAGAGTLWHRGPPPAQKPAVSSEELAEEAGLQPRRLIVDFRDDISPAALAATGFHEVPVSAYSAVDGLYQIDFAERRRGRRGRRQAGARSRRRERRLRRAGDHPARRGGAGGAGRRAVDRLDGGRVQRHARRRRHGQLPQRRLLQVPVAHAPDWHAGRLEAGERQGRGGGRHRHRRHQGRRPRRHQVRRRLQLRRQQRQRRRRPRPRHARRRHDRRVDQQQARRGRRRLRRDHHAAQGALRAGLGLDGRHLAVDPLGRRPRRQRHQHEPGRRALDGPHGQGHQVRPRQGRGRGRRRRQRRARPGELPGALPGRHRRRGDPAGRGDDLLFELGPGGRSGRAGRQHARQRPGGRPAAHHRPGRHQAHRLPLVHGDLDGVAARGRAWPRWWWAPA